MIIPALLLFCALSGENQELMMPLYVPASILVGTMFGMFVDGKIIRFSDHANDLIMKLAFYTIFALGILTPITFVIVGIVLKLDNPIRYWAAVLMLICTFRVWQLARPHHEGVLLKYLAIIFALIYPNITGIALSYRSAQDSLKPLFSEAKNYSHVYLDSPNAVITGAAIFYSQAPIPIVDIEKNVLSKGSVVLTARPELLNQNWRTIKAVPPYFLSEKYEKDWTTN